MFGIYLTKPDRRMFNLYRIFKILKQRGFYGNNKQLEMRSMTGIITGILISVFTLSGFSQDRWSAEFRPGLNFPAEQIMDVDVSTGFGFEITAAYNVFSHFHIYAGWSWNEFRTDEELGNTYLDLEESGLTLGLQVVLPLKKSRVSYILRGGAVYNQFEFEDMEGEVYANSGYSFGWQVETGIGFNISSTWSLRPLVRYRTIMKEFEVLEEPVQADLNYYSLAIGLVKKF